MIKYAVITFYCDIPSIAWHLKGIQSEMAVQFNYLENGIFI